MRRVYPAADFPLDLGFRGLGDFKGLAKKILRIRELIDEQAHSWAQAFRGREKPPLNES
jgi:hypothetical protein